MSVQQETSAHKISERNTGAQFLVVQNKNECATSSIIETKNGRLYAIVNPYLLLLRKSQDLPHNIQGLIIYNNRLYANTNFALYEWDGLNTLVQKSQILSIFDAFGSLIIYNNKLYAGGRERLWEWNGINAFIQRAHFQGWPLSYVVYNRKIYAISNYLLQWDGISTFIRRSQFFRDGTELSHPLVCNNRLYCLSNHGSVLWEWNGVDTLIQRSSRHDNIYNFFVFNNNIFVWGFGGLFQWDGISTFIRRSQFLGGLASHMTYNSRLYIFTDGRLWEWNGVDTLIQRSQVSETGGTTAYPIIRNNRLYIGLVGLWEWNGIDTLILKSNQQGCTHPILFNEILFATWRSHLRKYNHHIAPP